MFCPSYGKVAVNKSCGLCLSPPWTKVNNGYALQPQMLPLSLEKKKKTLPIPISGGRLKATRSGKWQLHAPPMKLGPRSDVFKSRHVHKGEDKMTPIKPW